MGNAESAPLVDGSVAVVTGGAQGIGRATVEAFAAAGAHPVIMDVEPELAHAIAERVGGTACIGNIGSWADCQRAAHTAESLGLPVRWLVNNAAMGRGHGESTTPEDWDFTLGACVKGTAMMATCVAPLIRAAGGGAIVNIASIAGHVASPDRWTYGAAKGAVLALTRYQALDLAVDNIRVNSISPGAIWTDTIDRLAGGDRARVEPLLAPQHMMNRVGEPSEVAGAVLYLCSPAASFVTGVDLPVDGGYLAMGHDRLTPDWRA